MGMYVYLYFIHLCISCLAQHIKGAQATLAYSTELNASVKRPSEVLPQNMGAWGFCLDEINQSCVFRAREFWITSNHKVSCSLYPLTSTLKVIRKWPVLTCIFPLRVSPSPLSTLDVHAQSGCITKTLHTCKCLYQR